MKATVVFVLTLPLVFTTGLNRINVKDHYTKNIQDRKLLGGGYGGGGHGGGGDWSKDTPTPTDDTPSPTYKPTYQPTEKPTDQPTPDGYCIEYIEVTTNTDSDCDASWDGIYYYVGESNGYSLFETKNGTKQYGAFDDIDCSSTQSTTDTIYYWAFYNINKNRKIYYKSENEYDASQESPDWDCTTDYSQYFKSGSTKRSYTINSVKGCYHPCTDEPTTSETTTTEPTTAEPTTADTTTAEPTTTEPTTAEPTTAEPTTAEPTTSEPTTAEPTTAEPTTGEPTTAEPTTAEPTTAELTTAEPTTGEPTTAEPTTAEPTTAEPTTAEPTTAEPTTAEPTTAEPTTAEPTTAEPTTAKPTGAPTDEPTDEPTEEECLEYIDITSITSVFGDDHSCYMGRYVVSNLGDYNGFPVFVNNDDDDCNNYINDNINRTIPVIIACIDNNCPKIFVFEDPNIADRFYFTLDTDVNNFGGELFYEYELADWEIDTDDDINFNRIVDNPFSGESNNWGADYGDEFVSEVIIKMDYNDCDDGVNLIELAEIVIGAPIGSDGNMYNINFFNRYIIIGVFIITFLKCYIF